MQTNRFLGSMLLVAGTSIGAGMLALPVSTAAYGFLPSVGLFIVCWFFMMVTGLLLLEANLWLKPGSNIVSMATQTLGVGGKIIAWITYLLLFYSLMAAYVSGMGDLIQKVVLNDFHIHIYDGFGSLLLIVLVGIAVYFGTRSVDYLNRCFFAGKLLTYLAVVFFLLPHIDLTKLAYANGNKIWLPLTIIITSFGFHNVIPSLRVYLNDDAKKLRIAIIMGSSIPLIVYIIWQFAIVGVVPVEGKEGLLAVLSTGQPATGLASSLTYILQTPWIASLFKLFTFFAITTSFTGVSFSLFDFLMDSFSIKQNRKGRYLTLVLTFLPPLLFAFFYPNGFILALGYAGIFVAILLGVMPALMVWSGRYWKNMATGYQANIGKLGLILVIAFSLIIIAGELAK